MILFFRNKFVWIGLAIIIVATCIFTFAFMGSTVNPTPTALPIGLIVEDEGIHMPSGEQMNFSHVLVEEIQKGNMESVEWKTFTTKETALQAMNEKELYASILLPGNLTENISSLTTKNPQDSEVTIILNEGMSQSGVNAASQITTGVLARFNQRIQSQLITQIEELDVPLTTDVVKVVEKPVLIKTEKVNEVAANNANGNTPALFTQIIWLLTFMSSMTLFTLLGKIRGGISAVKKVTSQIIAGIVYVMIISGVVLFIAVQLLEVSVPNTWVLYTMMVYVGLCFFFLQNALLNWFGFAVAPLFIILLFFSMPILTIAPEMLPAVTREYLYSWIPFRFSLEGFRDIMFFEKGLFESGIGVIGVMGIISLFFMVLSVLKSDKRKETSQPILNEV